MRSLVRERGLEGDVEIDSAGTGTWHLGEAPDRRATEAAAKRGVTLEGEARKVRPEDFTDFDLVVAMDREVMRELRGLAPDEPAAERVKLLRDYDPASEGRQLDVPDPFYGGDRGFDLVLDHVDAACRGLLETL
jgi:protein-tyrosine phosphatase